MFKAYNTLIKFKAFKFIALKLKVLKLKDNYVLLTFNKIFLLISIVTLIILFLVRVIIHFLYYRLITKIFVNTLAIILLFILVTFFTRNIILKL